MSRTTCWTLAMLLTSLALSLTTGLRLQAQALSPAELRESVEGTWQGLLHVDHDMRVSLIISRALRGEYSGKWIFVDEAQLLPVSNISENRGDVNISVGTTSTYSARLSSDRQTMAGTLRRGNGSSFPLILQRVVSEAAWDHPEPKRSAMKLMPPNADPSWEVASVKLSSSGEAKGIGGPPRLFKTSNTTLYDLIAFAFSVAPIQIEGGSTWTRETTFDIMTGAPDIDGVPSDDQVKKMLRKLLSERFGLKFHTERIQMPAYVLSATRNHHLRVHEASNDASPQFVFHGAGDLSFRNANMDDLCNALQSLVLDHPFVNLTSLQGRWDGAIRWAPDPGALSSGSGETPEIVNDMAPSLLTAIREQLGLRLSTQKEFVTVMKLDHAEMPDESQ